MHWKCSTNKALKMSSRNLSSARERNICNVFALVRRNVVMGTCSYSGFPVIGSVLVETKQIFVPLAKMSASLHAQ